MINLATQLFRRVDQHGIDDRRAAHVGDLVFADRVQHGLRFDTAQANVGAVTPARPTSTESTSHCSGNIGAASTGTAVLRHVPVEDVAHRVQVGTTMVIDDTLLWITSAVVPDV